MPLINSILNLACLLLWLNWLSLHFDPLAKTSAASLVGTLRKADPSGSGRWLSLAGVVAVIFIRTGIYSLIGPALDWTPRLSLPPMELAFHNDSRHYLGLLLFSCLSFLMTLAAFYSSLLLLSVANRGVADTDQLQKLVRLYFKWLEGWPTAVKLLLPWLAGALFWIALHPLLGRLEIVSQTKSNTQLFEQAAIIGAGAYLSWQYLIIGVLAAHLFCSYVYLGENPLWGFVNVTARNLLQPLRWVPLRIGRVDLLPIFAIALVLVVVNFPAIADKFSHPPGNFRLWLYRRLPF